MSYLPGSEPATKSDLDAGRQALEQRMERLEQRMERLEQRMERLEQRMERLEQRMDQLFEMVLNSVTSVQAEIRAQTRMFILASLGSSATLAVAIVSAAAVL
jgi:phage shock protein A